MLSELETLKSQSQLSKLDYMFQIRINVRAEISAVNHLYFKKCNYRSPLSECGDCPIFLMSPNIGSICIAFKG